MELTRDAHNKVCLHEIDDRYCMETLILNIGYTIRV